MAMTEPMVPTWTLGDRMRKARVMAGLEQADMAEQLGVSRPTISGWERDRTEPRATQLLAWAEATGHNIEWLLGLRSRCFIAAADFPTPDQMQLDLDCREPVLAVLAGGRS